MDSTPSREAEVSFSDIYITDQLQQRPARRADYLQEKIALQDLTALMSQAPEEVLPRFVELAMELTEGVSAGLSVLEPEAPKVFRWRNLCGSLKVFEGACTPRDDSPCGITLDQARPILTRYSERGYQWIAATKVILPEVLLVPLYIDGPEPLGTLWVVSDEECHFDSGDARVATELATFVSIALKMKRREERLRAALDAQALLTGEMSHRLKNVFAVTQSIVNLTMKDAGDKFEMAEMLSGRLQALANAHTLVLPALAEEPDRPLDLKALLEAILKPHQNTRSGTERFVLHGPAFECDPRAGSSIALIVHELATNAVKYGALTVETGVVDLGWKIDTGFLVVNGARAGARVYRRRRPRASAASSSTARCASSTARSTATGSPTAYPWKSAGRSMPSASSGCRLRILFHAQPAGSRNASRLRQIKSEAERGKRLSVPELVARHRAPPQALFSICAIWAGP